MPRIALFPGSFDPVTNGHLDIVRQAARIADTVVLAIGTHPGKTPMLPLEVRLALLEKTCAPVARKGGAKLRCTTFDGLVVDAAKKEKATILIRGLRDGTDFDYEIQMAGMNGTLAPGVQTVFLAASPELRPISSTLVRQIASMRGDVSAFVPAAVAAKLKSKFAGP